jgi:serine O-acetyltransferase
MDKLASLLDADWARLSSLAGNDASPRRTLSSFSPRFAPVVLLRCAHALHRRGWPRVAKLFSLANFVLFGLEAPARLEIGPGLVLMHTQGTVLGAARIGSNVTIFHQVTLGAKAADLAYRPELRPIIGDDVVLSAGAKVLGALTVGAGATIGANAVVLKSLPPNCVAVGVPAKVLSGNAIADADEP